MILVLSASSLPKTCEIVPIAKSMPIKWVYVAIVYGGGGVGGGWFLICLSIVLSSKIVSLCFFIQKFCASAKVLKALKKSIVTIFAILSVASFGWF
jgi:hypothetical protein